MKGETKNKSGEKKHTLAYISMTVICMTNISSHLLF